MAKKDLASVTTDLSALAAMMPSQRPANAPQALPEKTAPAALKIVRPQEEEETQFSLSLRKELRKQLDRLASDADMTMRAFVLNALKEKGLSVCDDDLADKRKKRSKNI